MSEHKTDNSALEEKLLLRQNSIELLKKPTIKVLDCFGGEGIIWNEVRSRNPGLEILSVRIDKRYDLPGIYLRGDNLKYLQSIPLQDFDVIDLDAYGSPFEQLEIIFRRSYKGIIHCTFIQSALGSIQHELLKKAGYNKRMITKCPTLFRNSAFDIFSTYLALNGVQTIEKISLTRDVNGGNSERHYFWFQRQ